ncbi:dTDP-glucose 4,6-dehydratase [Halobacillus andaensis]|uniref:dTDP-glucose 4,6-dehydratase n=1 Tax=Halobacillus andaensis TaxID=1176239 RepID=A0A917EXG8_HALAA|nr:NAD-dependent epimerase/dehydratase family protein [Halobacillus andaensis]MBP2005721.1 nucleoside-diphosphate-sugar epimerase [Halobacillus andaensis]GGF26514.1 dTDP-glucose 4,6-dehydratase [Halobacillus andaensis]
MNVLVTGGAGFIGRWVVKKLLDDGHNLWVLDNLSNGRIENVDEFLSRKNFKEFIQGDIKDASLLEDLFLKKFDCCYHLGASINVQDSIDDPKTAFKNETIGTFNVLEECKRHRVKIVFTSTCMVYDSATTPAGIKETDAIKPASPYAGAKMAAENMVLSYFFTYGLPAVVVRPFNTYGPFQKAGREGGVVAIFIKNKLEGKPLQIYGDGTQTRDLLYVEDCANFVVESGYSDKANGEILNAGLGRDIPINDLASLIVKDVTKIQHVKHIHSQSEIKKLLCNYDKAMKLLRWKPVFSIEGGIKRTEDWMKSTNLS